MNNTWKIWIDTGGTFTDCIAISPESDWIRAKVLSNGSLRGAILQKIGPRLFRFHHQWPCRQPIFEGYQFLLLSDRASRATILAIDFHQNRLLLDQDLDIAPHTDFEITAEEEAPLLAIRLVTQTPLQSALPPVQLRLGTTKGTNALLEGKGARTALIITKGFADLPYIGTQQRPHLFQLAIPEPDLLYQTVIEVDERLDASGKVLRPLDLQEIPNILQQLKAQAVEAVAIALLHSYANPIHEQQLAQAVRLAGFPVSASSDLSPTIQLLPRTQTALINASLTPVIRRYLQNIQTAFDQAAQGGSLKVMTSAGGLAAGQHFQPKDSLLSGPAGGVVGAARIGESLGFQKLLTLDMGGTSTDTARYDHAFDYAFTTHVGPYTMRSPALSIETVAAGGGSICSFDGFRLTVGPESAGAFPGPACYGAGGPLTITDVNLLLGKLDPAFMGIPVRQEKAHSALLALKERIEEATGHLYTEEELLLGFERIANEKMAEAIRRISVAKGFDPSDYALLVFGGSGGLHACKIAELLHIEQIILPADSGLLSAYGIGHAETEKIVDRQVLEPLEDCSFVLPELFGMLERQATALLKREDIIETQIAIQARTVFLRFQGQDHVLDIPFSGDLQEMRATHREKYSRLFGHYPENRPLEVERLQVLARSHTIAAATLPEGDHLRRPPLTNSALSKFPVYDWGQINGQEPIAGPAILCNPYATAFLEPGWSLEAKEGGNLLLRRKTSTSIDAVAFQEAIELELFSNRFTSIALEMGALLRRSAFSVNIKERLDFSCAILDPAANLLVNAPHIPVHLGSLGICARLVLETFPLEEGDVIITNHPQYGGSHLPDITLIAPVFSDQQEHIGYVVNRAHHAEIGGKSPGSMPPDARSLQEEGVVIPPTYLVKGGHVQWSVLEKMLTQGPYPTRALQENLADINAGLAALRAGQAKLQSLAKTHGVATLHFYMARLKRQAAETLQAALGPFQGKTFKSEEYLDDGNKIAAAIHFGEAEILFDFEGTAPAHPLNLNANIAIVYSVVIYVLRLLCQKEIPLNEGLMEKVRIKLPPHSLLHPTFHPDPARCPPVVGGNTEVSQRLVDTLLKALQLASCSQGTMNNLLFGNDSFGYYETIAGGCGAGAGFHGRSAVHQHMTNTRITDPEVLEKRFPVRLWQFARRRGSGGNGRWKGGDGVIREMEFLEPLDLTLLTQHRTVSPYGAQGGDPGLAGKNQWISSDGTVRELGSTHHLRMEPGDRILVQTPGGGGWGKP